MRNRRSLGKSSFDPIEFLLDLYKIKPKSVLDIGCSDGWRLERLRKRGAKRCVGVDASLRAVREGKKKYPKLELKHSTVADLGPKEQFDFAVVNFVLHWVSRETLIQSLAGIDSTVKPGGFLIVGDFAPQAPTKNRYHHLPKKEVWTYKEFYADMFTASGTYFEVARLTTDYRNNSFNAEAPNEERSFFSLLRKL